jgi:hypothetical protein
MYSDDDICPTPGVIPSAILGGSLTMESYITLDQANQRGVPYYVLNRAIKSGIIDAIRVNDLIAIPEGAMELLEPELVGIPIRITDAAEKYDISQPTLSRWANAGYINTIEQRYSHRTLDEADVKRAVTIYKRALEKTGSTHKAGWALRRAMKK